MSNQFSLAFASLLILQAANIESQSPETFNLLSQESLARSAETAISPTKRFSDSFRKAILDAAPQRLKELVEELKDSRFYQKSKVRKMLLYGPTGSGKTTIVQAIAEETGRQFIPVNTGLLGNEYKNSETQTFQKLIEQAALRPSILFIDESDVVFKSAEHGQDKDLSLKILKFLDNIAQYPNIFVFGATNNIKGMSKPLQNRFVNEMFEVPLINSVEGKRKAVLMHLNEHVHNCNIEYVNALALRCHHFSNRDLEKLVDEAHRIAFLRKAAPFIITQADLEESFLKTKNQHEVAKDNRPSMIWGVASYVGSFARDVAVNVAVNVVLKKAGIDVSAGGSRDNASMQSTPGSTQIPAEAAAYLRRSAGLRAPNFDAMSAHVSRMFGRRGV